MFFVSAKVWILFFWYNAGKLNHLISVSLWYILIDQLIDVITSQASFLPWVISFHNASTAIISILASGLVVFSLIVIVSV